MDELVHTIEEYIVHLKLYETSPTDYNPVEICQFVGPVVAGLLRSTHGKLHCRYMLAKEETTVFPNDASCVCAGQGWRMWEKRVGALSCFIDLLSTSEMPISEEDFASSWVEFIRIYPLFAEDSAARELWPFIHSLAFAWGVISESDASSPARNVLVSTDAPIVENEKRLHRFSSSSAAMEGDAVFVDGYIIRDCPRHFNASRFSAFSHMSFPLLPGYAAARSTRSIQNEERPVGYNSVYYDTLPSSARLLRLNSNRSQNAGNSKSEDDGEEYDLQTVD
jgi:hypothetical protein